MEAIPVKSNEPLGEREFEVWAEDSYPPYILLVIREESKPPIFRVLDPREGNKEVFSDNDYQQVCWWLGEDEYEPVAGRMKVLE